MYKYVEVSCECRGENSECPKCGGLGRYPVNDRAIIQETEADTPPNMQALSVILHQHDPEWETSKEMRKNDLGLPSEITNGIDVTEWLQKEMEDRNKLSDDSQALNSE